MDYEKEWNELRDELYAVLSNTTPNPTGEFAKTLYWMLNIEAKARGVDPKIVTSDISGVLDLYRLLHQ